MSPRSVGSIVALAALTLLAGLTVACTDPSLTAPAPEPVALGQDGPQVVEPDPDAQADPATDAEGEEDGERGRGSDDAMAAGRSASERPAWLGTRVLPTAPDGFGLRLATPPELLDRRLVTPALPDPVPAALEGEGFAARIGAVPDGVLARSTWTPECPVSVDELRYVTVRFVGFDDGEHTGELIVHADVAEDVVEVFAALHAARFPLEEVRVIAREELSAPPTGDGNVTSAFVCRPTVGGTRWSEHASGRAIDLNPFHNPYVRGDLVIPELAGAYTDRDHVRAGMVLPGDAVTAAFARIGWGWGGDWTGPAIDPMHFSVSGR